MSFQRYARRQLNPFSGVLQIVAGTQARAFSSNGLLWQVQVAGNRPDHTWRSGGETPATRQFFNWAMWSPGKGLHKVIANPILDIGAMSSAADRLVAALPAYLAELPFPLHDHYELWACDRQGQPLALLSSGTEKAELRAHDTPTWLAGGEDFTSASLQQAEPVPNSHATHLERCVQGLTATADWVLRNDIGNATRLADGHRLPASSLPPLGLREAWEDPQLSALVADYHRWLAPLLLTLPELPDARRAQLERDALARAPLAAGLYRLYPKILDPQFINTVRVETRLRHSLLESPDSD